MENHINTSQEIIDFYKNRLVKAFYNLVLCKNYSENVPTAIDGYIVLIHPHRVCGIYSCDDYEKANEKYETLKWAAQVNLQMKEITNNKNI